MLPNEQVIDIIEYESEDFNTWIIRVYQKEHFHYLCQIQVFDKKLYQIIKVYKLSNDKYIFQILENTTKEMKAHLIFQSQIEDQLYSYRRCVFTNKRKILYINSQAFDQFQISYYIKQNSIQIWKYNKDLIVFKDQNDSLMAYILEYDKIIRFRDFQWQLNQDYTFLEQHQIFDIELTNDNYLLVLSKTALILIKLYVKEDKFSFIIETDIDVYMKFRRIRNGKYINDYQDRNLDKVIINTGFQYICYQFKPQTGEKLEIMWVINSIEGINDIALYISEDYAISMQTATYFVKLYQNVSRALIQRYSMIINKAYDHYYFTQNVFSRIIYVDRMQYEPYSIFNPAFTLVSQNVLHFEREDEYDKQPDKQYYNLETFPLRSTEMIPILIQKMSNTK